MFLGKIGADLYKKCIAARKDVRNVTLFTTKYKRFSSFSGVATSKAKSSVPVSHFTTATKYNYSTSVRPQMTATLQQWKKKKRKSKAQQKNEMEQLQQDLVKILTKRAIQLVKNKSLLDAQRRVILTHAFTNMSGGNDGENHLSLISSESCESAALSKFINKSDFIAHQVEAHLTNPKRQNMGQHVKQQTLKALNGYQHAPARPASQTNTFLSSAVTLKHSAVKTQTKQPRSARKSFLYSELFPESLKSHSILPTKESNFESNFKNFVAEIEIARNKNLDVSHSWREEYHSTDAEKSPLSTGFVNENNTNTVQVTSALHPEVVIGGKVKQDLHIRRDSIKQQLTIPSDIPPSLSSPAIIPPSFITAHNTEHAVDVLYDACVHDGTVADSEEALEESSSVKSSAAVAGVKGKYLKDGKTMRTSAKEADKVKVSHQNHKKYSKLSNLNVSNELQELIEKSFVDACCFSGNVLLAVRNLQYLSLKQKISSVDVFNRLIHSLAKKKDLKTVKILFAMIVKQGLSPTLQTYAACLECFGRMNKFDVVQCQKLISDARNKGLDIGEIANQCNFESDEFNFVLKAIKAVEPTFQPNPPHYDLKYKHELLTYLNTPNNEALEKNQYALDMSKSDMMQRVTAQLEMEQKGEVVVDSIYTNSKGNSEKMKCLQKKVLESWNKVLLDAFQERLLSLEKKAKDNGNMTLYPYLKLLPPEDYVKIIFTCLRELFSSTEGYSPAQTTIKSMLGQAVNRRYNIAYKTAAGLDEKILTLYTNYMDSYLDKDYVLDNHRCMWLRAMGENFDTVNMDLSQKKWPGPIHKEIGNFLLDMILYDLKINANLLRPSLPQRMVPAFSTIYRPDITMLSSSEIKLHPIVARLFKVDSIESFTFDPSIVPMLSPPVPWVSKNIGGLMLGSPALIRMGYDMHHLDILKNVKDSQFPAVLDSLNTLSACAWIINKPVLDLQIEIFNSNGNSLLKISPPAADLPPLPTIKAEMTMKDKATVYRERMQLQQQKQDVHGLWCSDLYRLSIANKYRDEIFWFPHSMDFRGRTYPLPPHFNHLGSDNVRGMLLFAKGKRLGEKGYDWLKIHLVNLTGFKKRCSNQERLDYANSIMDLILDSADRPMTGNKWWQKADEPWQALACCMEIAKIERYTGRKEDYICHFPVHQDGSCNGLQHYAALGRDQAGAESVNLHPFENPKDVYSDVVELVEKIRKRDAEQGNEIAKVLEGFVKRKVIKQTIMTTVYGVTRFGAKLQIHRQLKDIKDFPIEQAWPASIYLTHTTFSCLREMFTATKDIQDWLTETARQISTFAPVDWVTPLGFPVLQPYFKKISKAETKHDKFKPNGMKQKNAFPPNFIHSLDSTHMMLTSLYCMHAGTTFVSVHDCYWTHACDVPIMNKICREQFVSMHKQPLLEDLSEHLIDQVKKYSQLPHLQEELKDKNVASLLKLLTDIPRRGTFDLNNVLKSTYFFS
ncbi:DNA-directed RNA polymerase, mitochondrial-like [Biomphalaria glabrata]|uniref:DNA-directed RNA polymerase n=1 Tax=Biomphalaria glabrata TaxID=6526 RepID=A0A9W3AQ71_BIOGL|nr:DNA-directed RNA polymerase, mitochondrial-like [Biomphalaria glabrata]